MRPHLTLKILYAVLGGFAMLSLLLVAAVQFINWNSYKADIAAQVSERLDLELRIGGDVAMSLLPGPELIVADVALYRMSATGSRTVAQAQRIDLALDPWALLTGGLKFDRLALEGADITLVEDASGWRLAGWERGEQSGEAVPLTLDNLSLTHSHIRFQNRSGTVYDLEGMQASLKGTWPAGPMEVKVGATLHGEPFDLDARLTPVDRAHSELAVHVQGEVAGADLSVIGRFGDEKGARLRLRGSGKDVVRLVNGLSTLSGGEVFLEGGAQPFELDLDVTGRGQLYQLGARSLRIGESAGRFDGTLTVPIAGAARKDAGQPQRPHLAARLGLSVLDGAAFADWRFKEQQTGSAETGAPITGDLEFTIEALATARGAVQQITGGLQFGSGPVRLTYLRATAPGGTRAQLSGEFAEGEFEGRLLLESSNIPALLENLGQKMPRAIRADRLATMKLAADLGYENGVLALSGIDGRLDNIALAGGVSLAREGGPVKIALEFTGANIDGLLSKVEGAPGKSTDIRAGLTEIAALAKSHPVQFDALFKATTAFGQPFEQLHLKGQLNTDNIRLERFAFQGKESAGLVSARFDRDGSGRKWQTDMTVEAEALPASLLRHFWGAELPEPLKAGIERMNANLSGPLDAVVVSGEMALAQTSVSADGSLRYTDGRWSDIAMRISLQTEDLTPFLHMANLDGPAGGVAARLSGDLKHDAGDSLLRLTGTVAGGQIMLEGEAKDGGEGSLSVDFRHARVAELPPLAAVMGGGEQALSLTVKAAKTETLLALTDLKFTSGDAEFDGALTVRDKRQMEGRFSAKGLRLNVADIMEQEQGLLAALPDWVATLEGKVAIALTDIEILGQTLTMPGGTLHFADGTARLQAGEGALLGHGPMAGNIAVTQEQWNAKMTADALDMDGLLASVWADQPGAGPLRGGRAALRVDLTGEGWQQIAQNMRGAVQLSAAGGALHFIDALGIAADLNSMTSSKLFLQQMAMRLRGGTTPYQSLEARLRIDGGVALLDQFEARGTWGNMTLEGQVNLREELLALKGELFLNQPAGSPAIPLQYDGPFTGVRSQFASRLFERFAISQLERRLRTDLLGVLRERTKSEGEPESLGGLMFRQAAELMRQRQKAQQKAEPSNPGQ